MNTDGHQPVPVQRVEGRLWSLYLILYVSPIPASRCSSLSPPLSTPTLPDLKPRAGKTGTLFLRCLLSTLGRWQLVLVVVRMQIFGPLLPKLRGLWGGGWGGLQGNVGRVYSRPCPALMAPASPRPDRASLGPTLGAGVGGWGGPSPYSIIQDADLQHPGCL